MLRLCKQTYMSWSEPCSGRTSKVYACKHTCDETHLIPLRKLTEGKKMTSYILEPHLGNK